MDEYARLEKTERAPKRVVDHSATWAKLAPISTVNGTARERIDAFCATKNITVDALEALGARVATRKSGAVELAFAGDNGNGAITAVKYRPVNGSSHDSYAESPSTWIRPIVIGNRWSLDWLIVEGETDAARLWDLVGNDVAILVLPNGANVFKNNWAALIPRGATVALCHDGDEHGDKGATKAASIIGGRTIRVRPPAEGTDWCDWHGGQREFRELLAAASAHARAEFQWTALADVVAKPIVYVAKPFLLASAFHLLAGIKNAGKGTWLACIAARVSRGEYGGKRHVLWIALGEDSYSIDVKPRIVAAGGDQANVTVLERTRFVLPDHADELIRKAAELDDVGMIVVDPVGGAVPGKNTNFDTDIRPALQSLNQVADTTEAMVFGVRHLSNKPERRRDGLLAALLGSSDWANVPRCVLALLHDDVDKATRHLFVATGNRAPDDTPGLMFRIEGHLLDGHEHEVTRMVELGASAKDPDELLATRRPRQSSKSDAARTLILRSLQAAEGQSLESDVLDAEIAKRTGLEAKTVRNIRSEMRKEGLVRAVPQKDEEGEVQRWFVTLTGAGIAAAISPDHHIPTTHNLSGSGLNTPDPESRVSGPGDSRDLGDEAEQLDFVTQVEAV